MGGEVHLCSWWSPRMKLGVHPGGGARRAMAEPMSFCLVLATDHLRPTSRPPVGQTSASGCHNGGNKSSEHLNTERRKTTTLHAQTDTPPALHLFHRFAFISLDLPDWTPDPPKFFLRLAFLLAICGGSSIVTLGADLIPVTPLM